MHSTDKEFKFNRVIAIAINYNNCYSFIIIVGIVPFLKFLTFTFPFDFNQ